jgi:hypothetical protein
MTVCIPFLNNHDISRLGTPKIFSSAWSNDDCCVGQGYEIAIGYAFDFQEEPAEDDQLDYFLGGLGIQVHIQATYVLEVSWALSSSKYTRT